jgi:hypothetical protein
METTSTIAKEEYYRSVVKRMIILHFGAVDEDLLAIGFNLPVCQMANLC